MGPASSYLRRCLWVGCCGVPPPRPRTSWPLTQGQEAQRCARGLMARSSSPKIMFVCILQSLCQVWLSTTQVRLTHVETTFSVNTVYSLFIHFYKSLVFYFCSSFSTKSVNCYINFESLFNLRSVCVFLRPCSWFFGTRPCQSELWMHFWVN